MKRELRNQFNKMKKSLKSSAKVQEAFNEMYILLEMVVNHLDETVKSDKEKK